MNEAELVLVNDATNCTIYSFQFKDQDEAEIQRFYNTVLKASGVTDYGPYQY